MPKSLFLQHVQHRTVAAANVDNGLLRRNMTAQETDGKRILRQSLLRHGERLRLVLRHHLIVVHERHRLPDVIRIERSAARALHDIVAGERHDALHAGKIPMKDLFRFRPHADGAAALYHGVSFPSSRILGSSSAQWSSRISIGCPLNCMDSQPSQVGMSR